MKTSKLIEVLQESLRDDGDLEILLASDEEGNRYNPLVSKPCLALLMPRPEGDGDWLGEGDVDEYNENERDEDAPPVEFKATHLAVFPG